MMILAYHNDMSVSYEKTGRTEQKSRTRHALLEAARSLMSRGMTPTVEQAAAAASISRPTAYRYFSNQHALLAAAYPELAVSSLLPLAAPQDPEERLELLSEAVVRLMLQNELPSRTMLRLSLEGAGRAPRGLRRVAWVEDALAPMKSRLEPERYRSLVLSVAAMLGIEAFVWLVDGAGLQRSEAATLLRSAARELLRSSL
jgi:AcrR family transcriptional regulator